MPEPSPIAPFIAPVGGALSLLGVILAFALARARGYREQAGRQDREARATVMRALQDFAKQLQQEETRRKKIQSRETVIANRDLRYVDCLQHVWNVLDAAANPTLDARAAASVERRLRGLVGDAYITYLKKRIEAPERPKSWNDLHNWMRELVQSGAVDVMKPMPKTLLNEMFDTDSPRPESVAKVRREVDGFIKQLRR